MMNVLEESFLKTEPLCEDFRERTPVEIELQLWSSWTFPEKIRVVLGNPAASSQGIQL